MNDEALAAGGGFPLSLLTTLLALAGVLALAWVLLRAFARFAGVRGGGEGRLQIVRSVAVGARERVVLLRHDGHDYLLGVSAGGITLLERSPSPARAADAPDRDDASEDSVA